MREKIEAYNKWLFEFDTSCLPVGLLNGKMGLCLYWYLQAKCFNEEKYEKKASELLDSIYVELERKNVFVNFEDGITGIAFSIDFLLTNSFVEGNKEDVLKDLDDIIFRHLYFDHIDGYPKKSILSNNEFIFGIYLAMRIKNGKLSKDNKYLYKSILIEEVNRASSLMDKLINSEPMHFSPFTYPFLILLIFLNEIVECNFYNKKIKLLFYEWARDIKSIFPMSNGHRSLVEYYLSQIISKLRIQDYEQYLDIFKKNTDIEEFIHHELLSRNVDIYGGVGLWSLFFYHNKMLNNEILTMVNDKINNSILWEDWERDKKIKNVKIELSTTLTGIILAYQIINELWKK